MKQKSMFLNLKNILHRDATDGCSAVISPKAPSEREPFVPLRRARKMVYVCIALTDIFGIENPSPIAAIRFYGRRSASRLLPSTNPVLQRKRTENVQHSLSHLYL